MPLSFNGKSVNEMKKIDQYQRVVRQLDSSYESVSYQEQNFFITHWCRVLPLSGAEVSEIINRQRAIETDFWRNTSEISRLDPVHDKERLRVSRKNNNCYTGSIRLL